ncbi:MAG TPA: radical SAM protein [Thermoanaerobaculia bacterium]|nr:radical SAM protein [Thermoanaerobaculia bacterium]
MADILLTHGYFLFEDEKERQIMKPYPTLGLLYLSAYLRREGFDVEVFDTTFAERGELHRRLDAGRGVVGIYTNLMTRPSVLEVVAKARAKGWTVVLGGPEAAGWPEEYLSHGADVIVDGEGERTMAELLPALAERGPHRLHGIAGTVFRDEEGRMVKNPAREQIEDLDSLPYPDRGQIDTARYVDVWRTHHGMGSVNLITARGCPYHCRWCSHAVFGFTHRRRSAGNCADELEHIRDAYRPDQVWYADDVFTINHRWLFEYAAELKRRDLKLPFETISRADRMMKEEVLETLADMGCYRIWIGSESGSRRVLDAMERGVTPEQVQWACQAARRHGIEVGMFLMWGYEGETVEDIEATIDHVKKSDPGVFLTTVAYPIKNTAYYQEVADRVVPPAAWASGSDRDHAIRGRHSRTYYKHADQWLRQEVESFRLEGTDPLRAAELREAAARSREALLASAGEAEA